MAKQSGENVVRVLPNGFGDDKFCVGIDLREDLHAFLLAADETVFAVLFVRVCPN